MSGIDLLNSQQKSYQACFPKFATIPLKSTEQSVSKKLNVTLTHLAGTRCESGHHVPQGTISASVPTAIILLAYRLVSLSLYLSMGDFSATSCNTFKVEVLFLGCHLIEGNTIAQSSK